MSWPQWCQVTDAMPDTARRRPARRRRTTMLLAVLACIVISQHSRGVMAVSVRSVTRCAVGVILL